MRDENKSKEQLIKELAELRQRVVELETAETERKRVEETLRESEATARALINAPDDAIGLLDLQGIILDANEAVVRRFCTPLYELIGLCAWDLFPPDVANRRKAYVEQVIQSGKPVRFEDERQGMWNDNVLCPVFDAEGNVSKIAIIARDITKRKRTEEALKQKITELNSFINNIPDMAWLKDIDSRFIAVNKAFCETVGISSELLINQSCEVCFGKEAARKFREDDQQVISGGRQVIIEEKIIDAQNNEVWLETIKSPILSESGQAVGTVGIARNISTRKQMEETLRKREKQYREQQAFLESIYNGVDAAIFVVDVTENGEFRYAGNNEAHQRASGLKAENFIGKTPEDLIPHIPPEVAAAVRANYQRCLDSGQTIEYDEKLSIGGQDIWALTRLTPLKDESGRVYRIVGISTDITERKWAEEALQESEATARALLNAPTDSIFLVDTQDIILTLNKTAARKLDRRVDELVGLGVDKIFPPDIAERKKAIAAKARQSKKSVRYEDERAGMVTSQ